MPSMVDDASHNRVLEAITAEIWDTIPKLASLLNRLEFPEVLALEANPYESQKPMIESQTIPQQSRSIEDVIKDTQALFARCVRVNDPRFLSFIPSAASFPVSWLGELLASAYNAYTGNWLGAMGVTATEVSLVAWLASQIGYPAEIAGGTFVSGGSIANLTGLSLARDQILPEDQRHRGVAYMSTQTHFSVPKALRLIGITNRQMRRIPCTADYRIDMDHLKSTIQEDIANGLLPFVIIANSGTTNTGAIDPLHEIADLAATHKMWVHVDGSYGASVALSKDHRHLIAGIERADSIAWDCHKWLFQTWGCGVVLVQDKRHLLQNFGVEAEYLREITHDGDEAIPNTWNYGIELSKPARHMRLWFSLQVLGSDLFAQLIDHGFTLGRTAEEDFRKLGERWEIVSPATMAILNFRYRVFEDDGDSKRQDEFNTAISAEMMRRNKAVMMTTELAGKVCLRMCSINPLTSVGHMREIVGETDGVAQELERSGRWGPHTKASVNGVEAERVGDDVASQDPAAAAAA